MPADDLTLALRIRADAQQAVRQLRAMERGLGNIDKRGRRAESTLRRLVGTSLRFAAAYLSFRAVAGVLRTIVGATEEQAQAVAQLERGLANLEGQTGLTSAGLQAHAADLQQVTTAGDEATIRLQSLLLTFRKIDDTNFNRVVEASLDLAAAIGQEPRDAALQLGKALEDPVQGLTALRRSGTVFSQEQTRVIRALADTNRLADAQALILAEVERQYRGAARAQRETVGGAAAALRNAFGDLLEIDDGAENLRLSLEDLAEAVKSPGFARGVRGLAELFADLFAGIIKGAALAAEAIGILEDVGQQTRPVDLVNKFVAGGLDPDDLRDFFGRAAAGEEEIVDAIETALADRGTFPSTLIESLERDLAAFDENVVRGRHIEPETGTVLDPLATAAQRRALQASLDRARAGRASLAESDPVAGRLAGLLAAGQPGLPAGFTFPGPLPQSPTPVVEPDTGPAERATEQLQAARSRDDDALARLILTQREQADRRLALNLDEIDRLAATEGVDPEAAERARTAARQRHAAERNAIAEREAVAEFETTMDLLDREAQARKDAARANADALASIERREVDLGIVDEYQAAVREADRWRARTLATLDETDEGYAGHRARVQAVYNATIEAAWEASDEQAKAAETWIDGAREGLAALRSESNVLFNVAKDSAELALGSIEDAIVELVTTGKLNFKDFANSVIADLARIAARRAVVEPLAAALFDILPEVFGPDPGAVRGGNAVRRLQAGVGHAGLVAGAAGGVTRRVPPGLFAFAPRFHAGGVAGLRPDEVPIIAQAGETVLPRGAQIAAPAVNITFENRGTPQREVQRRVDIDPRGAVVTIVTDDLDTGGPMSRAISRRFGLRGAAT